MHTGDNAERDALHKNISTRFYDYHKTFL